MADANDVQGGNIFKQAWVTITSFFGSFLSGGSYDDVPDEATGLTRQHKNLIRKSWELAWENKLNFGIALFIRLFREYPASQDLFEKLRDIKDLEVLAKDKKMKAHALRVMAAFNSLVDSLDQVDILEELLRNTAITHYRIRMPAHYFEDLGGVLLATMDEQLGDKFTPKMKEAWSLAYTVMVKIMMDEMEELEPSKDASH